MSSLVNKALILKKNDKIINISEDDLKQKQVLKYDENRYQASCHQIQEYANKNTLHQLVLNKESLLLVCCIKEDVKSRITIEVETLVSSAA